MSFLFPDPPQTDYAGAAAAQGAANKETAIAQSMLNNPNTYTPYGNQIYSGGEDGGRPTLTQTLSPTGQRQFDMSNSIREQLLGQLEHWGGNNVARALSQSPIPAGTAAQDFDPRFMPDQGVQTDSGFWSAAPMQEDVNLAAASPIPGADAATRAMVTNAIYSQGARFLDPQFAQRQDQLNSDLSNQGIFRGSDAFSTAQDDLDRQRMQQYGDLRDRAIMQGGEEMARDFGLGMQAHQQGVSDILQSAGFHNQARGDMINQLLADMSARNSALTTSANIATQGSNLYNSGRAQSATEAAQGMMLPINASIGLLSGTQVQAPNFQATAPTSIAPPPIYQAAQDTGAQQMAGYNANQAMMGNFLNAGARIGSAMMS